MPMPLISFVMTTYNHEAFVAQAVQAALDQQYPNLEVVVYDDCSTDGTWDAVCRVVGQYRGPHAVVTHRQPQNVGPFANTVDAVNRAHGQLLVRAHGDDISMPDRVARVGALWQQTGATIISHNALKSAGLGQSAQLLRAPSRTEQISLADLCRQGWTDQMLGATFSFDRVLFETFEMIDHTRVATAGDHVLPLRAALLGGFWYLDEPLLMWRQHPGQMTWGTADFKGSVHGGGETMKALDLPPQLQRLADVATMRKRADRPELAQATQLVLETIANTAVAWQLHRKQLESEAQVLDWAPRRRQAVRDPNGAAEERHTAAALSQAVDHMLVVHRMPASPNKQPRMQQAVAQLVSVAETWVRTRNRLHNAGLRPSWMPPAGAPSNPTG